MLCNKCGHAKGLHFAYEGKCDLCQCDKFVPPGDADAYTPPAPAYTLAEKFVHNFDEARKQLEAYEKGKPMTVKERIKVVLDPIGMSDPILRSILNDAHTAITRLEEEKNSESARRQWSEEELSKLKGDNTLLDAAIKVYGLRLRAGAELATACRDLIESAYGADLELVAIRAKLLQWEAMLSRIREE